MKCFDLCTHSIHGICANCWLSRKCKECFTLGVEIPYHNYSENFLYGAKFHFKIPKSKLMKCFLCEKVTKKI